SKAKGCWFSPCKALLVRQGKLLVLIPCKVGQLMGQSRPSKLFVLITSILVFLLMRSAPRCQTIAKMPNYLSLALSCLGRERIDGFHLLVLRETASLLLKKMEVSIFILK
uniref:Uncharacterized protein n=1 Tax=Aegilops tauschii subsp. strangulata TaxID=200361 RepID=A0A453Q584_AEGTS